MDWQPIETAPKDDKQVPVWNPDNPYGEWPYMGLWDAIRQTWIVHIDGQTIHPTHWLQLPDPPTVSACKDDRQSRRTQHELPIPEPPNA